MTPVMYNQLDTIMPSFRLGGSMVTATVSSPQPNTTVCEVVGSVGLVSGPYLAGKFSEAVHDGRPHVVIDLSAVILLDSRGMQIIFAALDCLDIGGHLAVVIDPRSAMITRSDITALGEVIDIHHDLASALRACARAFIPAGGRHRAKITI